MSGWIESYRGSVAVDDVDTTEHLTVSRYYARFADATLALMAHHGLGIGYMRDERKGCATVACKTRYLREFHIGDALHMQSALLRADGKRLLAGHRVYDSATGELTTEMTQSLLHIDLDRRRALDLPADRQAALSLADWAEAPLFEERPMPADSSGFIDSLRDTVKPWEIDVVGHMSFQFYVSRFSSAGAQLFAAMGITPGWQRAHRRGFSTFDYQLRFLRELNAGDLVMMKSALLHLGNSSLRILHRLYDVRSGEVSAELDQSGVLLDLDARRPARIADEVRTRAQPFVVSTSG